MITVVFSDGFSIDVSFAAFKGWIEDHFDKHFCAHISMEDGKLVAKIQ